MMFKKCVGLVLAFAGLTFLVSIKSAQAQAGGPPCPAETCAVRCHSVGHVYDELSGSQMCEIHCSSCHLMGRIQEEQYLLGENEEEGFNILGYVTFTFNEDGDCEPIGHRIYDRKQLCVRCHDNAHHVQGKKDCCDCHMETKGLTTYRVHVYPDPGPWFPVQPDFTYAPENIFKFVTREHRSHTFEAK